MSFRERVSKLLFVAKLTSEQIEESVYCSGVQDAIAFFKEPPGVATMVMEALVVGDVKLLESAWGALTSPVMACLQSWVLDWELMTGRQIPLSVTFQRFEELGASDVERRALERALCLRVAPVVQIRSAFADLHG